jgi:hypothetical protein
MAADDNPYPMRALAAQLRAIGDQGYALADYAPRATESEMISAAFARCEESGSNRVLS